MKPGGKIENESKKNLKLLAWIKELTTGPLQWFTF